MKRLFFSVFILAISLHAMAQYIIRPTRKTPTSFAIIIDSTSYVKAKDAVMAYKNSVENDGLGTYIAVATWRNPEAIKSLLKQWHSNKQQPLEGAVFVGDIPIPMIRDAQYLTSAFKMNQKSDWKASSVPSDRYYDDFGLTFKSLKQDAEKQLYFYYSLSPKSKTYLSPDIYTGRIKPLEIAGKDKYELLKRYLYKVARLKNAEQNNVLDHLTMARGHGYNSEDRGAWAGEQLALREQLPSLFGQKATVKFLDFDTFYPAKLVYLNEAMDPQLDVLLFHHHGAPDTQYLNGNQAVSGVEASIKNIKRYLHAKVAERAKKVGADSAVSYYTKQLNVPESWCREAFNPAIQRRDSSFSADQDIYTSDLHQLKTNARFVLFDACFNGSFHADDNIAGSYLFNDGSTIATIGGTVNALQDKWPDEFIGLLATGMRVGNLNRFNGYLESHVIGDPTFHFTDNVHPGFSVNLALSLHHRDAKFWMQQLNHPLPDVQAMALRQLWLSGNRETQQLLTKKYNTSKDFVVRMEALKLLSLFYPEESVMVLKSALNDSYELVRRLAAIYASRNGSPELIPSLVHTFITRGHEPRLGFQLLGNIEAFDSEKVSAELNRQLAETPRYSDAVIRPLRLTLQKAPSNFAEVLKEITNQNNKPVRRENAILRFRNKPQAQIIPTLLGIISNENEDNGVRIKAAHTLGWFDTNYQRHNIVHQLSTLKTSNDELNDEIQRTINRLNR